MIGDLGRFGRRSPPPLIDRNDYSRKCYRALHPVITTASVDDEHGAVALQR